MKKGLLVPLVLVALCCLGSVVVALPKWLVYGARSKAAECRRNLQAIAKAQRAHGQPYAGTLEELHYQPEGQRYSYAMSSDGGAWECTCTGNLDDDAVLDTWKSSSAQPAEQHVVDDFY